MSYVIHIWDQPTPKSLAEAQAVFERLWDQRAAPNPKFVELAQRMKAAFPEYGDDWDFGSPKDLPNDAVLAVGIHDMTVFYPRLVDAAVELGLSVYDDSTGECFVPGPSRLSPEGRERLAWHIPAPVPARLPDIEDRVRALVHPRLAAHGFRLEIERSSLVTMQTRWLRDTPLGEQRISLGWKSLTDGAFYEARTSAGMRPVLPVELAPLCNPQPMIDLHILDAGPLHRFVSPLRSGPYDINPVEISKPSQWKNSWRPPPTGWKVRFCRCWNNAGPCRDFWPMTWVSRGRPSPSSRTRLTSFSPTGLAKPMSNDASSCSLGVAFSTT